jgi:hypothetical protein
MSRKNAFIANQKNFISRKLYELHSKSFLRTKTSFAHTFLRCPQNFPFSQTKRFSFAESFANYPQKPPFLRTKSLLFTQTLPYCHPKQPFSTLHHPFQRPLTYCLQGIQLFF